MRVGLPTGVEMLAWRVGLMVFTWMAIPVLRIICAVEVLSAAGYVHAGTLRGAGDTLYPMLVTPISMWVIRVPLALVLGLELGLGLAGAWTAMALDLSLRGIIYYFRFRRGRWKLIEV
jgi:Na+-driven multidrug efflux pump